jgi:hypothetical protein
MYLSLTAIWTVSAAAAAAAAVVNDDDGDDEVDESADTATSTM